MAYTLAIAVLMIASSAIVVEGDLCSVYSQMTNMTTSHTSCLSLTSTNAVSDCDKTLIVDNHNRVRNDITDATDMLKMYWDDNLQDVAQRWADSCPGRQDSMGQRYLWGYISVGQNIAGGYPSWQTAMNGWESEKDNFGFGVGSINGGVTGNYTQMIWAESVRIGCGVNTCSGSPYYVCNYGPAGNYGYIPYTNGTTASDCQTAEGNLCDCAGKVCKNEGTINRTTCECSCPGSSSLYTVTDGDCTINCTTATDHWYCSGGWSPAYCPILSDLAPVYCPNMCGLCPAIDDLEI